MASYLKQDALVVVMSQVPAGTSRKILTTLKEARADFQGSVACVPENLQLGRALDSFLKPARTVIGADSERARATVEAIFSEIPGERIHMSTPSAEMSKHALNAFLATSLTFIYNIADVCEEIGADVTDVSRALKSDPRVGKDAYLDASIGFSGGTLMRDIRTLCALSRELKKDLPVIYGAANTLDARIKNIPDRIEKLLGRALSGARIAVFGLTYKKGTPTLRRSLSVDVMQALQNRGAQTIGYDPYADEHESAALGIARARDPYEAVSGAHAVIVMNELDEFCALDFARMKAAMAEPYVLFDARNFLKEKASDLARVGFRYTGVGR